MMNRRDWMALSAASALAQTSTSGSMGDVVRRHDAAVDRLLKLQVTDPKSRACGIYADDFGLVNPGTGAGVIDTFLTAYLQPKSKFYNDSALPQRIRLAAEFLSRQQTAEGNINLLITNFNSPPDTGFVVRAICPS